ncbi:ATP-grasp domain-containing protein [Hypomontagnella monticulosa]|nr:ATP-grasp domain-containing protein [Hypomontagnella monticulosa]
MSGIIVVRGENNYESKFQCSWQVKDAEANPPGTTCWQSFDVFLKEVSRSPQFSWHRNIEDAIIFVEQTENEQERIDFGSAVALRFVLDCLLAASYEHESAFRLIVPQSSGYIVRSDIIPLRLLDCVPVAKTVSFSKVHQYFEGKPIILENLKQLPIVFAAAAGGMVLKSTSSIGVGTLNSLLDALDIELRNRLSFPWLSMQVPRRKTLAIVDGGISSPDHGGTGVSIYAAAAALGIDMIVFDNPGHWIEGPRYAHWRKAFIPLELKLHPDADFANKIVEAVQSYKGQIDGIVSFRDQFKVPVAEAALQLGLSTYPPSAYAIATDKFKTSISEGHHAYRASSFEQATSIIREYQLEFPLIIKPTNGFLSEGVFRVEDISQLETSIQSINADRHGKEFVIEKYCEGPEVDANFVLCDGEVTFFEASDDFPKGADINGQSNVKTFIELANVLPSKLPENELAILRDSLHKSLLRVGFSDGFYHLEARVENSSMEYAIRDNILDLTERAVPAKGAPSAWLIEINPRPPGIQASEAIKHTYGIDYWGLGLLFPLDDKDRVKQLSHAFAQGPQYWCEMVFIPVEKGGVYESEDACAELFQRRPDLAACVSKSFCFLKRGDRVMDPSTGVNSWVAYFIVFSRKSRADLLEISEAIRQEVRFSIV